MLPFVLALCIWWMRIRWRDAFLAPFALISAVASAGPLAAEISCARSRSGLVQTFPERLIIAGKAIWFYLGELVWPHPLIFIYPRWHVDSSNVVAYLPLTAAIAALIALWFVRAQMGRALFFAAAYYAISLFPVLGFFSVYFFRYSFVSDHFQYLASMGPLALAGAGIATLLGCFCGIPDHFVSRPETVPRSGTTIASSRRRLVISSAVWGVVLVLLGFLTWRQTAEYHNLFALYTATLEKNPSSGWRITISASFSASRESGSGDRALQASRCPATRLRGGPL